MNPAVDQRTLLTRRTCCYFESHPTNTFHFTNAKLEEGGCSPKDCFMSRDGIDGGCCEFRSSFLRPSVLRSPVRTPGKRTLGGGSGVQRRVRGGGGNRVCGESHWLILRSFPTLSLIGFPNWINSVAANQLTGSAEAGRDGQMLLWVMERSSPRPRRRAGCSKCRYSQLRGSEAIKASRRQLRANFSRSLRAAVWSFVHCHGSAVDMD